MVCVGFASRVKRFFCVDGFLCCDECEGVLGILFIVGVVSALLIALAVDVIDDEPFLGFGLALEAVGDGDGAILDPYALDAAGIGRERREDMVADAAVAIVDDFLHEAGDLAAAFLIVRGE
jgi:hypothetical protein